MKNIIIILFLSCMTFSVLSAQENKELQFNNMIKDIYNFNPSEVNDKAILERKGKEMDGFWNLVSSDKDFYIPLLRKKLCEPGNNRFFYFDGTRLLLGLSTTREDMVTGVNALKNTSLNDVDRYVYFQLVHWIGCQGIDTYPAIENIINDPDFEMFIPQHALTLKQDYTVLYCVLVLDDSVYIDKLIKRLYGEKNTVIAKTLIMAIAYSVSEKGQKALQEFTAVCKDKELIEFAGPYLKIENKKNLPPKEVKSNRKMFYTFLNDLLNRNISNRDYNFEEYYEDSYYLVKKEDYAKIKELRKKQAQRVSDEALGEISFLTMLLQYSFTSTD